MKGQRVNIQYSVQIEELPSVLEKLLKESESRMLEIINDFLRSRVSRSLVVHENHLHCAEKIDKLRAELADIDYRLQDCSAMLRGLAQMKSTPPAPPENRMNEVQSVIEQTEELASSLDFEHPSDDSGTKDVGS